MLNQLILTGRLTKDIEVHESESGMSVATISLAIPRSFKNSEGEYDTDFIDCIAFEGIARNTSEYCKKGDIVGVKGRVQSRTIDNEKNKQTVLEIIAEKVTFLSTRTKNEQEKNDEAR